MKIRSSDYKEILDYLVQESWNGNRLVAFPDTEAPVEKEDLACFETVFEAKQYCYECLQIWILSIQSVEIHV
jgi:hypothetical protein